MKQNGNTTFGLAKKKKKEKKRREAKYWPTNQK